MTFGEPLPVAASLSDRVISVSSLSKTYGLPGIRVGWLVTRDPELFGRFLAAKEQILISGSLVDETIAVRALERRPTWLPEIRDRIAAAFSVTASWIDGNPRFEWVAAARRRRRVPADPARGRVPASTSTGSTTSLFERHGTIVGPGHWFEQPRTSFRLGYGWPTLDELRGGLAALDAALDEGPRVARPTRYVNSDAYALSAGWPPRCAYRTVDPAVDLPARHEVDEPGHRLPLVDRVRDHPLEPRDEPHRLERPGSRDPVRALVVPVVEDDLVLAQVALQPDGRGGPAGDPGDLGPRLGRPSRCRRCR